MPTDVWVVTWEAPEVRARKEKALDDQASAVSFAMSLDVADRTLIQLHLPSGPSVNFPVIARMAEAQKLPK